MYVCERVNPDRASSLDDPNILGFESAGTTEGNAVFTMQKICSD